VPLTVGGKLTIVASSDLGGLGAKDGAPVEYNWALPGVAPLLLPWAVILGLLALKPNRRAAAWLIWLPLGCVEAVTLLPPMMPRGADFLLDAIAALAFGLAAVWLLSGYLARLHRLVTFFCVVFVLVAFAAFAALPVVSTQDWNDVVSNAPMVVILLVVPALVTGAALNLSGWCCRGRYRPLALYLWLFVSLTTVWLLIAALCAAAIILGSGNEISWNEFFTPVLAVAAGNFALLLPFLILSSASPFYRGRLKMLLNIQPQAPPPLNAPTVAESNLKT
jgi:hypothetical protein